MLELSLLRGTRPDPNRPPSSIDEYLRDKELAAKYFRTTVMPYKDPLVSLTSRVFFMAYYILFPYAEKTTLDVTMKEGAVFLASGVASSLLLEIKAGSTLQTYSAQVLFVARLRGLRWLMYNHRIFSFFFFTTVFWVTEVFTLLFAYGALSVYAITGTELAIKDIKKEDDDTKAEPKAEEVGLEIKADENEGDSFLIKSVPPSEASSSSKGIKSVQAADPKAGPLTHGHELATADDGPYPASDVETELIGRDRQDQGHKLIRRRSLKREAPGPYE
jgi:hypothetical protein